MAEPVFFATEAEFRRFEANHKTAPGLLVGFWEKGRGKPSIDWQQARDQALCFGWIDGHRKSLSDDAYTIRFTLRQKGSIFSRVNVEQFEALTATGLMTPAGLRAYEENKHKTGVYSYEKPLASFTADEEPQKNKAAWADWEKRPQGYRKQVLSWIAGAKRPETRATRLTELTCVSAERRRLPQYEWRTKP